MRVSVKEVGGDIATAVTRAILSRRFKFKPGMKLGQLPVIEQDRAKICALSRPNSKQRELGGVFKSKGNYKKCNAHGATKPIRAKQVFRKKTGQVGGFEFIDMAIIPPRSWVGLHRHEEEGHKSSQEAYVITDGTGIAVLNNKVIKVKPGDVMVKGPRGFHAIYNLSRKKNLRMVVIEAGVKLKKQMLPLIK